MMTEYSVEGVLQHVDLGMGAWVIELPDGRRLLLDPAPGLSLRGLEGRRVRLSGEAPAPLHSSLMTGDLGMRVRSLRPIVG
jgi:hypothetical protein